MTTQFNSDAARLAKEEEIYHPFLDPTSNRPVTKNKETSSLSSTAKKIAENFKGIFLMPNGVFSKKSRPKIPTFTPPSLTKKEMIQKLIDAIKNKAHDQLRSLLTEAKKIKDFDINAPIEEQNNNTLLHFATSFNDPKILEILIDNKANVNIHNKRGYTPLQFAQLQNKTYKIQNQEAINFLQQKIDLEKMFQNLMDAIKNKAHDQLCSLLKKAKEIKGFDINAPIEEQNNNTLLHFATSFNDPKTLEILIDNKASVTCNNRWGYNPLQYAQLQNKTHKVQNQEAINFLRQKIGFSSIKTPQIPKDSLIESKYQKQITPTLRDSGMNALLLAIFNNDTQESLELISSNSGLVSSETKEGITPLHLACQNGNFVIVDKLVKAQASINKKDNMGRIPLHYAVISNSVDIVNLIAKESKLNIQDHEGNTPRDLATQMGRVEILKQLNLLEENLNIKNKVAKIPTNIDPLVLDKTMESIITNEKNFNPYLYFAKKTLQTIASAVIFQTIFSSGTSLMEYAFSYETAVFNKTLFSAIPTWIIASTAINTLLRAHQKTVTTPYITRRALGDVFAGIVVLSTMHFLGDLPSIWEIGKTVIGIYGTELFIKKAIPRISAFSSEFFRSFFSKKQENPPLLNSSSIKIKFS